MSQHLLDPRLNSSFWVVVAEAAAVDVVAAALRVAVDSSRT